MSLTRILKHRHFKPLRDKLKEDFPRPQINLSADLLAPPLTKNYGIVGTAFDYLMRFRLEYDCKEKIVKRDWIADLGIERMRKKLGSPISLFDIAIACGGRYSRKVDGPTERIVRKIKVDRKRSFTITSEWHEKAKFLYSTFLSDGIFTEELAKASIVLAKLDLIVRAGLWDKTIGVFEANDIVDLKKLFSITPINQFKPQNRCYLNPSFGKGSALFGGADADLVIDDALIDIKTSKYRKISRADLNQLLCYYVAARVGGLNGEQGIDPGIRKVGIYLARYGKLWVVPLEEFGTKEQFREFEEWLIGYIETIRSPRTTNVQS